MIHGSDNASYQPKEFPLHDNNGNEAAFAFIKATQGVSYVNPHLVEQTAWARKNGLIVGFYHFQEPGNPQPQVKFFRDTLVNLHLYHDGDLIADDWETDPGSNSHASNAEKDNMLHQLVTAFPHSKVLLYCNKDFWRGVDKTSYAADGLWIAAPDDPDGHPSVQHPWVIQQTSVVGGQDWNVANFADASVMRAWAHSKVPVVAPPKDPAVPQVFHDVMRTDAIEQPPGTTNNNGYWTAESYLKYGYRHAVNAEENSAAALELVKKIAAKLGVE